MFHPLQCRSSTLLCSFWPVHGDDTTTRDGKNPPCRLPGHFSRYNISLLSIFLNEQPFSYTSLLNFHRFYISFCSRYIENLRASLKLLALIKSVVLPNSSTSPSTCEIYFGLNVLIVFMGSNVVQISNIIR